jgi:hypothetical protein
MGGGVSLVRGGRGVVFACWVKELSMLTGELQQARDQAKDLFGL